MQSKLIEENYVLKENTVFELSMLPKSLDPDFLFIHFLWNLYFLVSHLPFFCERDKCKLNTQIKPDLSFWIQTQSIWAGKDSAHAMWSEGQFLEKSGPERHDHSLEHFSFLL